MINKCSAKTVILVINKICKVKNSVLTLTPSWLALFFSAFTHEQNFEFRLYIKLMFAQATEYKTIVTTVVTLRNFGT